jgi:hypothetical protein
MNRLKLVFASQLLLYVGAFAQPNIEFEYGSDPYEAVTNGEILFEKMELQVSSSVFELPFLFKADNQEYSKVELGTSGPTLISQDGGWKIEVASGKSGSEIISDSSLVVTLQKSGSTPNQVWKFEYKNLAILGFEKQYFNYQVEFHESNRIRISFGVNEFALDHPYLSPGFFVVFGEIENGTGQFPYLVSLSGVPEGPILEDDFLGALSTMPELNQWYDFAYKSPDSISESNLEDYLIQTNNSELCISSKKDNSHFRLELFLPDGREYNGGIMNNHCIVDVNQGVYLLKITVLGGEMKPILTKVFVP